MANRTILVGNNSLLIYCVIFFKNSLYFVIFIFFQVDNNTWNNTAISRVGQAMASTEDKAYEIMRELDVDYVMVIFGGLTGYSSDDINKFLWMVCNNFCLIQYFITNLFLGAHRWKY